MTTVAMIRIRLRGACGVYRLLMGPTLADRIVAMDVALIALMGCITIDAATRADTTNLILLVVLAIVGFTATVAASRFVEDTTS
ncbi:MAG: monovalent cation/H+ antiporter complex subunit F [Acidimicrobiales bacterium]